MAERTLWIGPRKHLLYVAGKIQWQYLYIRKLLWTVMERSKVRDRQVDDWPGRLQTDTSWVFVSRSSSSLLVQRWSVCELCLELSHPSSPFPNELCKIENGYWYLDHKPSIPFVFPKNWKHESTWSWCSTVVWMLYTIPFLIPSYTFPTLYWLRGCSFAINSITLSLQI